MENGTKTHVTVLLGDLILNFKYLIVVQPLEKTISSFLRKLKNQLPYDPAVPFLDIYQRK